MQCEIEYIICGKDSDVDNMEQIANDLVWMRMPINYTYLLSDVEKKEEAKTLALSLCTLAGAPEAEQVVEYLLLGCWAYGESLQDVSDLLAGKKVPYMKSKSTWKTDLKSLSPSGDSEVNTGLSYENYLALFLATKGKNEWDNCYTRMLEVMELNIQQKEPQFMICNCVGKFDVCGVIQLNALFVSKDDEYYKYYVTENIDYGQ